MDIQQKSYKIYKYHWNVVDRSGTHINVVSSESPVMEIDFTDAVTLVCKKVLYYSMLDEVAFCTGFRGIPQIFEISGHLDELYLHVHIKDMIKNDLINLLGLFQRYNIDTEQLKIFLNEENQDIFKDSKKYWYRDDYKDDIKIQTNAKITLICKNVLYYSALDEYMFFESISHFPAIVGISKFGDELYLHVKNKNISRKDLFDLMGLFYRYNIDMKQFKVFLTKRNEKWFFGDLFRRRFRGYWHKHVFGK